MTDAYTPPQSDVETENIAPYKLYKTMSITVATFFGSAIAGGYLMSQNLRRLGRYRDAQLSLIGGVLLTILLAALGFLLPENSAGGNIIPTIVPAIVMHQWAKHSMQANIDQHQISGGGMESSWKAFGIGLATLVGLVVVVWAFSFIGMSLGWID